VREETTEVQEEALENIRGFESRALKGAVPQWEEMKVTI